MAVQSMTSSTFYRESALWLVASVAFIALFAGAGYALASMMGWKLPVLVLTTTVSGALALTWGTWASLIWTENIALRRSMQLVTVIPAVLVASLACVGMYVGWGGWILWTSLALPGIGTIALALLLSREMRFEQMVPRSWKYLMGWTVFPLLSAGISLAVIYLCVHFLQQTVEFHWRSPFKLGYFMAAGLALSLVSTVIPAAVGRFCQRLAATFSQKQ